jgi:hypothetical protein
MPLLHDVIAPLVNISQLSSADSKVDIGFYIVDLHVSASSECLIDPCIATVNPGDVSYIKDE